MSAPGSMVRERLAELFSSRDDSPSQSSLALHEISESIAVSSRPVPRC